MKEEPDVEPTHMDADMEELRQQLPATWRVMTESMNVDELATFVQGYKLHTAKEGTKPKPKPLKLNVYELYAKSCDPAENELNQIYTMSEQEYAKYFPPTSKPKLRVPLESTIHTLLDKRFLMIREPAAHIITGLRDFAGDRFPKAAHAEALRDEWVKSGKTLAVAPPETKEEEEKEEEVVDEEDEYNEEKREEARFLRAKAAAAAAREKGEEEEPDDDYDLFGAEEDEDEEDMARQEARRAAGAAEEPLSEVQIYGTLKRLAVDENYVHEQQSMELPLTPLPPPDQQSPKSIFILKGTRGVGKTASLYHVIHWARSKGWVVFFISSAYEYLHEGGRITPSPFFKGFFDTPELAQRTLNQLAQAHGHQLSQLRIQDPAVLERSGLAEGSTLGDLVTLGLSKDRMATTALVDIKGELEKQTDYPVLFAVDDFSEWFFNSTYQYALKHIEAERLAVCRVMRDLVPQNKETWGGHHKHVAVVVARSDRYPRLKDRKKLKKRPKVQRLPWNTCYDVAVGPYSHEEFEALYTYLFAEGLINVGAYVEMDLARMLTGGVGEVLCKDIMGRNFRVFAPTNKVGKLNDVTRNLEGGDVLPLLEQAEEEAAVVFIKDRPSHCSYSAPGINLLATDRKSVV